MTTPHLPANISEKMGRTVLDLFECLAPVRYVVLRNTESYPDFNHDIDLVVHPEDRRLFEEILHQTASRHRWDALCACDHWAQSASRHHNIHIFKLYDYTAPVMLQIDVFHGYIIFALPWLDEETLLSYRIQDSRGFYKLDPFVETLFRMFQLYCLQLEPVANAEKIRNYREQILKAGQPDETNFIQKLSRFFSRQDCQCAWEALKIGDTARYQKTIAMMKFKFAFKTFFQAPLENTRHILLRVRDYWRNYISNPCGFVLVVHIPSEQAKAMLLSVLDSLQEGNLVNGWRLKEACKWNLNHKMLSWADWKILERGGIVVQLANQPAESQLEAACFESPEQLTQTIIRLLLARHEIHDNAKDSFLKFALD